jgi:hypothetical protein
MGVLVLKNLKNGFQKLKLGKDSVKSSIKKREGEINQNQE